MNRAQEKRSPQTLFNHLDDGSKEDRGRRKCAPSMSFLRWKNATADSATQSAELGAPSSKVGAQVARPKIRITFKP
ncbi:hypothetical protein OROMI_010294 [Orobanche minor]